NISFYTDVFARQDPHTTNSIGCWRQDSNASFGDGGKMKRTATVVTVLCLLVFCSVTIWAQGTAQISGTAKDQSGAVLPGVEVTVTQTETGISRNTVSNETGTYVLP